QPTRMGLRPWRLVPGEYVLASGQVVPGDGPGHFRFDWQTPRNVRHIYRGHNIDIEVPPRTEWVVDLRLREPIDLPVRQPDLAIAARELRWEADTLVANIHNLGGAPAGPFTVKL